MGTLAQNLREIGNSQMMTPVLRAHQVLDHDHNGLISIQEASEDSVLRSPVGDPNQDYTSVKEAAERLSQYDINKDTFTSINDELKPIQIDQLTSLSVVTPGEKCNGLKNSCPVWLDSLNSLEPNLDIISKVSSNTSVLSKQGEND
ncbi:MAG TPA: hypothetical protein VER14_09745 [Phototrophicaceae bacterium]|nr:hypothetical protein [Phototrophicaceae bacterium]